MSDRKSTDQIEQKIRKRINKNIDNIILKDLIFTFLLKQLLLHSFIQYDNIFFKKITNLHY